MNILKIPIKECKDIPVRPSVKNNPQDCSIILFNDINKNKHNKKCLNANSLFSSLEEGILSLTDKSSAKNNCEVLKECFEISCNILYDRKILKEVIEKQKKYESEYIVDFFKYVLKIFFNRYNSKYLLTKNQCIDVKKLCEIILQHNKSDKKNIQIIRKISSKEIIDNIKNINLEKQ